MITTVPSLPGAGDAGVHDDLVLSGSKRLRAAGFVLFDDHHVVEIDDVPLVQVKCKAAARAAECVKHTAGLFATLHVDLDDIAFTTEAGSGELGHAACVFGERPTSIGSRDAILRT